MKLFRKHKLPVFPPSSIPLFKSLIQPLPMEQFRELRNALTTSVESQLSNSQSNGNIDVKMLRDIYDRLLFLMDNYEPTGPKEKGLIVAAVRYFISDDDPLPDAAFASGLDDDARVVNYVLEELGFDNRFLKI